MKSLALLILCAVFLAACSRKPSPTDEAAAKPEADARLADLERLVSEQKAEMEQLRSLLADERAKAAELEHAKGAAAANPLLTSTPQGVTIATNNPLGQILQAVSTVMTNPAAMRSMREGIGAWGRLRGRLYDDFLADRALTEEQRSKFERLLRQRRNAQMSARWLGEEESARMAADAEKGLRELLGADYAKLETYEQQMPARMFAERFGLFLEDRQSALDAGRKTRLIDALAGLPGMTADGGAAFSMQSGAGGARDFGAAVERQLDQTVENYDRIVAAAKPILTADENKALDEYLGQRLQERELGAQLTKSIVPALMGTNQLPSGPGATSAVSVQTIIVDEP